jgi:plasmid stabilization system protein ParE
VGRDVTLTDEASESLGEIERWYTQPGAGAVTARRVQAILAAIAGLSDFPYMGRRGDAEGTRELTCQGHRIIYVVGDGSNSLSNGGDITVLEIFGPGRSRTK